jgi:hypothetical protein
MNAPSPYAPPAVTYGAPVYRSLGAKATAATIAIALTVPVHLVLSGVMLSFDADAEDMASAVVMMGAGFVAIATSLLAAVVFLVWFHGAAKNLRAFGHHGLAFTPGWCVGWWFIPFANLVKPYRAMQEIWRASHPDSVGAGYEGAWLASPVTSLLGSWWAAWLVSGFLDRISGKIEDVQASGAIGLAGTLVSALAAILLIRIMRTITRRQDASWEKLQQQHAAHQAVHGWDYRHVAA